MKYNNEENNLSDETRDQTKVKNKNIMYSKLPINNENFIREAHLTFQGYA